MVRYRVYWVSLRGAGLAFLLQVLEPRDHHRQQLHDDARRDVRHDAQREDRQLQQRAAAEQVDQAVEPAAGLASGRCRPGRPGRTTPGVGMTEPSRNRAMIASVKRIFRRRSGVRNARANAVSTRSSGLSRSAPAWLRGAGSSGAGCASRTVSDSNSPAGGRTRTCSRWCRSRPGSSCQAVTAG